LTWRGGRLSCPWGRWHQGRRQHSAWWPMAGRGTGRRVGSFAPHLRRWLLLNERQVGNSGRTRGASCSCHWNFPAPSSTWVGIEARRPWLPSIKTRTPLLRGGGLRELVSDLSSSAGARTDAVQKSTITGQIGGYWPKRYRYQASCQGFVRLRRLTFHATPAILFHSAPQRSPR